MNELLLTPTDVLFFRDGRPMGGSLAGHGTAWPLPTVTNAALHAALWRSGLADQAHVHGRDRPDAEQRSERFGSLTTAGPFPVCRSGKAHTWFFPAPADAQCETNSDTGNPVGNGKVWETLQPTAALPGSNSSAPLPLAVASTRPPSKDQPASWWSEGAWNAYLGTPARNDLAARLFTKADAEFSDQEAAIGIAVDPNTGTTGQGEAAGQLYSAHYLRLREGWSLGLFAETQEKTETRGTRRDLISSLLDQDATILVGGQQRLCSASRTTIAARLPLPLGRTTGFTTAPLAVLGDPKPRHLVKWVLLTPAIFPLITVPAAEGHFAKPHPGGWLPSWVSDDPVHKVQLRAPLPVRDSTRESRDAYRARVQAQPPIEARLVAAVVGKSLAVTGWSLGTPESIGIPERSPGAKATHLAVPAGSIYYFACATAKDAEALAEALNWHGADQAGTTIRNRRSTLLGEKGFGLGACGTWSPLA